MDNPISKATLPPHFDIEGHRGCRGLLPENSLPAFLKALELGVTTLEMDLVITREKKVLVSHEPYFSHEISLSPEKKEISPDQEKKINIYTMTYPEILQYDTGLKAHPRFPSQKKIPAHKPLLEEVIDLAENFTKEHATPPVFYNVEIKSTPEGDSIFHPGPEEFSELVYEVLLKKSIIDRTIVQCFDLRPLQYLHKKYPALKLSLLVENYLTPEFNVRILGFVPFAYSPDYSLVNEKLMKFAKDNKMRVIPWTVNTIVDIQKLLLLKVDGIITDYPDLFR